MWKLFHTALKVVALMGGLLSLYAAAFLYEDQYGRIQNKLEEWWIRLSDRQKLAVSWNTAFVREIAGLETRMFDRLFGKTLASFRAIGVSQCLSLASLGVAVLLGYVFSLLYDHRALSLFENLGFGSFTIVFTCLFLGLGIVPALVWKPATRRVWYPLLIASVWVPLVGMALLGATQRVAAILALALTVSFGCDALFIALTRWAIGRAANMDSLYQIAMVVLANCVVALLLFGGPLLFMAIGPAPNTVIADFKVSAHVPTSYVVGGLVAALNEINVIVAFVFIVLVLVMLLHRLFWPIINRPLYRLQALGIARRTALFYSVGLILLGLGGVPITEPAKKLLHSLIN